MKLNDIFTWITVGGITALCLARMSDNELHTSIIPYDFIGNKVPIRRDMSTTNNHAIELDSAQATYGLLFKRSEALALHNAKVNPKYAGELREKYGNKIGTNDIISAEKYAWSRKKLESSIAPVYNEGYFENLPPLKEFDFRKRIMENVLNVLEYTPKDIPYGLPVKELKQIENP